MPKYKVLSHIFLQPLNIFFDSENCIKIGDFGLVTSGVNDVSVERTMNKGTRSYMAPEQEGCNYGKEIDLFSLGLIFYEMLFPFSTDHEKDKVFHEIKKGNFPKKLIEDFPKEASLIKKLLSKERNQRPSAAIILKILKKPPHGLHTY
ncbi:PREDICTED: interferon-induced, double-stranded RNA-activated protein kinase-like [Thamnophis sirtalis]|uniref:Interferon-induced, double-stranded RNA-activated protein kinase-like n=1 Tax=Thamnophis sirtalis TaxID=35019 RepID=A0A6I9YHG6_9SAUR|nr:PREDICTED: interferon-induced, double-stranded RNA-activated protein kinase-like [Thamnophis sirtalis]XP_013923628.1 PREDICTED: interferon-induced, double-stranded RNA-activated protein kinase-like [Thamnophis sirtalis]